MMLWQVSKLGSSSFHGNSGDHAGHALPLLPALPAAVSTLELRHRALRLAPSPAVSQPCPSVCLSVCVFQPLPSTKGDAPTSKAHPTPRSRSGNHRAATQSPALPGTWGDPQPNCPALNCRTRMHSTDLQAASPPGTRESSDAATCTPETRLLTFPESPETRPTSPADCVEPWDLAKPLSGRSVVTAMGRNPPRYRALLPTAPHGGPPLPASTSASDPVPKRRATRIACKECHEKKRKVRESLVTRLVAI